MAAPTRTRRDNQNSRANTRRRSASPAGIIIRSATRSDLAAINGIYNHYVFDSTCTYQEVLEPMSSRRRWFNHHGTKHPITVAELEGTIVGWGSLSAYHARSAYRRTVENSVY